MVLVHRTSFRAGALHCGCPQLINCLNRSNAELFLPRGINKVQLLVILCVQCILKHVVFNVCCLVCFSREPPVLWQSPGCLHHALLSSGTLKSSSFIYPQITSFSCRKICKPLIRTPLIWKWKISTVDSFAMDLIWVKEAFRSVGLE